MRVLKQSTARDVVVFMTDSSDHVAGKTGLTLTITASKAAAAFASITPTVTELANGWYKLALTTAHTDTLGDLALHITATGADPSDVLTQVVAYDMADAVRLGLTALPNAAAEAAGGLYTRGTGAGQIAQDANGRVSVNILAILGTTLTETVGGYLAAAFKKLLDVATPVFTAASVNQTGDGYARIGAAGAGLTSLGDTRIANLDVAVSTRSTYAGADTAGTTTLLSRVAGAVPLAADYSAARAAKLDNLDTGVSTRLATAGYTAPLDAAGVRSAVGLASANLDTQLGAIDDYLDTEVAAIKAKTDNLPASPAAVGSAMTLTTAYDAAKTAASQASVDALPTTADGVTLAASQPHYPPG